MNERLMPGSTAAATGRAIRPTTRPGIVRVVFWNTHHMSGADRTFGYLDRLAGGWDLALLVECQRQVAESARERYGPDRVASVFDHYACTDRAKPHGPVVVAGPGGTVTGARLTYGDHDEPLRPRPDKGLTVEVVTPYGTITAIAVHVMWSGDGLERKQASYRELSEQLTEPSHPWPVVVGLDGNNWSDWLETADATVPNPTDDYFDEHQFHAPNPPHQLVDTFRSAVRADSRRYRAAEARLRDLDVLAGTYRRTDAVDRMDRIYASPDLQVIDAGIDDQSFDASDHALVWADLLLSPAEPTIDPEVRPKGPSTDRSERPSRDLALDEIVQRLVDGYGWNRRGYVARVALATIQNGGASKAFIDDHYRGVARPARRWNPTRTTCNRSWQSLGGQEYGDEFIQYDRIRSVHSMHADVASAVVDSLGIPDLLGSIDDADLDERLAARLDPHSEDGEQDA